MAHQLGGFGGIALPDCLGDKQMVLQRLLAGPQFGHRDGAYPLLQVARVGDHGPDPFHSARRQEAMVKICIGLQGGEITLWSHIVRQNKTQVE